MKRVSGIVGVVILLSFFPGLATADEDHCIEIDFDYSAGWVIDDWEDLSVIFTNPLTGSKSDPQVIEDVGASGHVENCLEALWPQDSIAEGDSFVLHIRWTNSARETEGHLDIDTSGGFPEPLQAPAAGQITFLSLTVSGPRLTVGSVGFDDTDPGTQDTQTEAKASWNPTHTYDNGQDDNDDYLTLFVLPAQDDVTFSAITNSPAADDRALDPTWSGEIWTVTVFYEMTITPLGYDLPGSACDSAQGTPIHDDTQYRYQIYGSAWDSTVGPPPGGYLPIPSTGAIWIQMDRPILPPGCQYPIIGLNQIYKIDLKTTVTDIWTDNQYFADHDWHVATDAGATAAASSGSHQVSVTWT